jgi:response regulator RpfG family c-di-GMP phosphodiesterase
MSSPPATLPGALRVVICDYNALLHSVTGLLRMSGYYVFQAYNGQAAEELCAGLPGIGLLVLNTEGTGMDTPALVRSVRKLHRGLPVLHIGTSPIPGMPSDVLHLAESFTADQLLETVSALMPGQPVPQG